MKKKLADAVCVVWKNAGLVVEICKYSQSHDTSIKLLICSTITRLLCYAVFKCCSFYMIHWFFLKFRSACYDPNCIKTF